MRRPYGWGGRGQWHGGVSGSGLGKRRLAGLAEDLVHGGLQVIQVHAALAKPLLQRDEGGVGEQFGHAREWAFSVVFQGSGILFANSVELDAAGPSPSLTTPPLPWQTFESRFNFSPGAPHGRAGP